MKPWHVVVGAGVLALAVGTWYVATRPTDGATAATHGSAPAHNERTAPDEASRGTHGERGDSSSNDRGDTTSDTPSTELAAPTTEANTSRRSADAVASDSLRVHVERDGAPTSDATCFVFAVPPDPAEWRETALESSHLRERLRGAVQELGPRLERDVDANGDVVLAWDELEALGSRVVVWAAQPGCRSVFGLVATVASDDAPRPTELALDLESTEPVHATVVGPGATAATVEQAALHDDFALIEGYTDGWLARITHRVEHRATGAPVELCALDGLHLVRASCEGRVSRPFVGALTGDLELRLAPAFTVSGRCAPLDHPLLEGVVRVQGRTSDGAWRDQGVGALELDGTFHGVRAAFEDDVAAWRVRVDALGIPSVAAPLDAAPGADLDVVVDVPLRAWFAIRVVDAFERRPVPGAVVTVRWPECVDGELREVADDQGWAGFYDLPRATAVELRIEAEGYVTFGPTTTFTERSDEPLELPLWIWPQVAIRFDTEPEVERAADVRCSWRPAGDARGAWREAAVARVDGRLAASGVEGDDVELLVATDRGSCGPFAVAIERPVTELGRIELEPYRTARVRVLDARSGFQLVDARVGVSAAPGVADGALELSSRTDASGVAELARVPANAPVLVCSAPGYADAVVTDFDDDAGVLDFGDVALRPRLAVRVQLVGGCPDPERWSIDTDLVADPPAVRFDEFGSARIVVDDTDTDLLLIDSEGRTEWLTPDRWPTFDEGAIEWPVSPERLRVELDGADASGPDGRDVHWLALTFESSAGFHTRNEKVVLSQPSYDLRAIPVVDVGYRVRRLDGTCIARGEERVAPAGTQRLALDLGAGVVVVRVEDLDGVALPGSTVLSFDRRTLGGTPHVYEDAADANGEALVPLLPGGALGVAVLGPGGEVVPDVDTSGWKGGGTHTVELRVPGVLDVAVRALDVGADEARAYGGAKLELRRGDDAFWLVKFDADAAGRARYAGLAESPYVLEVEGDGYWKRVHRVDVAAGDNPLATTLFALAEVHLRVVDGAGAAIAGAPLSLVHVELGESVADWIREGRIGGAVLVTDARGEFDLTGVPCGTYRVAVGGSDVGLVRTDGTRGTVVVP